MRRYDRIASSRRALSYAARRGRHDREGDARRASIVLIGLFGLLLLLAVGAGICAPTLRPAPVQAGTVQTIR
jgi:hypothetical protein